MMESDNALEYTGKGCVVPKNVTIVRFHPSVTEVDCAFYDRTQLREVVPDDKSFLSSKTGRETSRSSH